MYMEAEVKVSVQMCRSLSLQEDVSVCWTVFFLSLWVLDVVLDSHPCDSMTGRSWRVWIWFNSPVWFILWSVEDFLKSVGIVLWPAKFLSVGVIFVTLCCDSLFLTGFVWCRRSRSAISRNKNSVCVRLQLFCRVQREVLDGDYSVG